MVLPLRIRRPVLACWSRNLSTSASSLASGAARLSSLGTTARCTPRAAWNSSMRLHRSTSLGSAWGAAQTAVAAKNKAALSSFVFFGRLNIAACAERGKAPFVRLRAARASTRNIHEHAIAIAREDHCGSRAWADSLIDRCVGRVLDPASAAAGGTGTTLVGDRGEWILRADDVARPARVTDDFAFPLAFIALDAPEHQRHGCVLGTDRPSRRERRPGGDGCRSTAKAAHAALSFLMGRTLSAATISEISLAMKRAVIGVPSSCRSEIRLAGLMPASLTSRV